MKKLLITGTLGLALSAPVVQADSLGIYAGAHSWKTSFSGDINSTDTNSIIDLEDTLGFDDSSNNVYYIALEHPIPLLPNIKLQQTKLEIDGDSTLGESITFDGITFPAGTHINSDVDFSHTDATLYYQLLDNWVSLDLGLTARKFDGFIDIADTSNNRAKVSIDNTVPMLYAKAQFDLPLTGLSIGVDGNIISYSGNSLSDINATINYEFSFGLGLAAGYRVFNLSLDDVDDIDSDLTMDGTYAALTFHF
jgi:outer membrane protein